MDHEDFHPQDLVIQSKRFQVVAFTEDMAQVVHENSLDENNHRFLPDEVYHSTEDAKEACFVYEYILFVNSQMSHWM